MGKIALECKMTIVYENCNVAVEEVANRLKNALKYLEAEGLITGSLDAELEEYSFEIKQVEIDS